MPRTLNGPPYKCPRCQEVEVQRPRNHGRLPYCPTCKEAARQHWLDVQREYRKKGYDSHRDASGKRYGDPLQVCYYCGKEYIDGRRMSGGGKNATLPRPTCQDCMPIHGNLVAGRKQFAKRVWAANPERTRRLLTTRLNRVGLTIDWFDDADITCGICRCNEPGGMGRGKTGWHFDHDHRCCFDGCPKCFRGFLCHSCNTGIGIFKDDPMRLRAAADYLERAHG